MKEQPPGPQARLHKQIEDLTRVARAGSAFLGAMVLLVYTVLILLLLWLIVTLASSILSVLGV